MEYYHYLLLYYGVVNIAALILYGVDKRKAVKQAWRIPERTLILWGFLGGGVGSLLGMLFFRHKIRKLKFRILVPFSILLHVAIVIGIVWLYQK